MERLSNETLDNAIKVYRTCIENAVEYDDDCEYNPILDKATVNFLEELKEFRDLEEQGLILKLPCNAGTEVHKIVNNTDACADCNHYSDFYGMDAMCDKADILYVPRYANKPICEKQFFEVITVIADLEYIILNRKNFGKTVFLTKEEAEKALAEMGE